MINPSIFRQYDIRGIWKKDLTPEVVELLGRGFASYLLKSVNKQRAKISIGRDARLHSPAIRDSLIKGLTESGIDVTDLGMCPTPLQYYSLYKLQVDGGVMITGSHNPPEFNGFKLSVGKGTIFGDSIQEIRKIIDSGDFRKGRGTVENYPVIDDYIECLKNKFEDFSGLKVVVDAGNGTGGTVAPKIMKALGAEVIELYCDPDGRFPNHHPDPTLKESLTDLIARVKQEKAHVGIGYDGDADRIGVVDEEGNIIWGDRLMIIFSRDILKENPGAKIIGEVKCSQTLYDDIAAHGGIPIMWKTGHSLIKEKMKKEGALLAGEMSGHLFFGHRYFGFDDAIYASLRLMEVIKKAGEPYSTKALLKDVPDVISTPEIRFDCPDNIKFRIVEQAQNAFNEYESITIDGIRIKFDDGWALIRASNTQPVLVLRFEAQNEKRLKKIRGFVEGRLNKIIEENRQVV
ncbi:MAG TPA: phosphomannomutase/phosphoglucomutase [Nitrospirae bacterium]|nr:phosphomannomutase/phosphoglucomutase [Nitrospirota bacterium]HDZ01870.1 phosphomannomutase/phosphoglucomutase [Nitrospirota bacterium]